MMIVQMGALNFNAIEFHSALREDLFEQAKRDSFRVIARAKENLEKTLANEEQMKSLIEGFGEEDICTAIAACKHGIRKLENETNEWVHASPFINIEGVSIIGYILHVVHENNLVGTIYEGQHVLISAQPIDGEEYYDWQEEAWGNVFHACEEIIGFPYHAPMEGNVDDKRDELGFSI